MAHHLLRILHLVWYPCAIQMGRHGVQDCHMSISKKYRNDYIWLYTWLHMIIHDYIWLYIWLYIIWLYMTIYYIYMIICTYMYSNLEKNRQECPGWHRWSFPIFFAYFPDFQLVYPFGPFYACISRLMLTICWASVEPAVFLLGHETATFGPEKRQHASVQVVKTC